MLSAVFLIALGIHTYRDFPQIHLFSVVAGVLWCFGNSLCVPAINRIGMGLGLVMWSAASLIVGWGASVTGICGNNPASDFILSWPLNITGVSVALFATVVVSFVKTSPPPSDTTTSVATSPINGTISGTSSQQTTNSRSGKGDIDPESEAVTRLLAGDDTIDVYDEAANLSEALFPRSSSTVWLPNYVAPEDETLLPNEMEKEDGTTVTVSPADSAVLELHTVTDKSSPKQHVEGIILAIIAGIFFGINYNFIARVMDTVPGASQNALDHVFAFTIGGVATSYVMFITHAGIQHYQGKPPQIYPKVTFPAFLSGTIWKVAQVGSFIANKDMSQAIAWPFFVIGPSLVGVCWGVFYLKEIKGTRNTIILIIFFLLSTIAAVLIILSRSETKD